MGWLDAERYAMKNTVRTLFSSSLALALVGTAVCHFGVRYSISQIPQSNTQEWEISIGLEPNGSQSEASH